MSETDGFKAYRHQGVYYRTLIYNPEPDVDGDSFASQIPQDAQDREAWINSTCELLEAEEAWRRQNNIPDDLSGSGLQYEVVDHGDDNNPNDIQIVLLDFDDHVLHSTDILRESWGEMPKGKAGWTYVIDFDNRAFTIDGRLHLNLDNMPQDSIEKFIAPPNDMHAFEDPALYDLVHLTSTPIEHTAIVARWPPPSFDIAQIHDHYGSLNVKVMDLKAWGAPDWTQLSVTQELSAELTRTVVLDQAIPLSNPDLKNIGVKLMNHRWLVLNATAPANLCSPVEPAQNDEIKGTFVHSLSERDSSLEKSWMRRHYGSMDPLYDDEPYRRECYRFRGCLVVFCSRLDAPEHVEYETVHLVNRLRAGGRTNGVGLAFSGRHVLAVAIDNDQVRCSPPLMFYDAKMALQDGFLLTTHLLRPLSLPEKTTMSTPSLPSELVQAIVLLLDDESYQQLPFVSRLFREIYAATPRVLDHYLMAYLGDGNFRVCSATHHKAQTLHLQRHENYTAHRPLLERSFQYIHRAPSNIQFHPAPHQGIIDKGDRKELVQIPKELWHVYQRGHRPAFRAQIVEGVWDFVDPTKAQSNYRGYRRP